MPYREVRKPALYPKDESREEVTQTLSAQLGRSNVY